MTLPYLTDDCIYYILKHLQSDRSALFKCLLVNRFWCKTTIPLLYADPFANLKKKNYSIILTLLYCFNRAEILQLKNHIELTQITNTNFDEEHEPLFEYLKYLESYNFFTIKYVITLCCPTLSKDEITNIIPIFHRSIIRQCKNLRKLQLFYDESYESFYIENFTLNLAKLNSLSLSLCFHLDKINENEQECLNNIANICLNLRNLTINLPQTQSSILQHVTSNNLSNITMEKLCAIIQKQKALKKFIIMNSSSLFNNILLSLEFQNHSLVQIEFKNIDFINVNLDSFKNLYNLKCLVFVICKGILLGRCEVLNFASFKLEELSFERNFWNVDVTSLMIKYLGGSLQRLLIENPTTPLAIPLIKNISMYCPNLMFLEIRMSCHNDLLVIPFFKNLRTSLLNIRVPYYYYSDNDINIDDFFLKLANNIPINISKISINLLNPNNILKYKKFLENCHNNFEIINLKHIIELELLEAVLNYIERSNNNLKVIGMKLNKRLNYEESNLLGQIRDKGVKVIDFYRFNVNIHNYV